MSGVGAGYDYSAGTYSPDGRVFQVEYAQKATSNSGTIVAINCKDGVIMGGERLLLSRLLVKGDNVRLFTVDLHIGIAVAGYSTDGRFVLNDARNISSQYYKNYGRRIPPKQLAKSLSGRVHLFTLYGGVRPLGVGLIIIGYDEVSKSYESYGIEASGTFHKVWATSFGKGQRAAKTELEKLLKGKNKIEDKTCKEALKDIAKVIEITRDETKDKPYDLELSWICPESQNEHQMVPKELRDAAVEEAKTELEAEDDDSDEDDESSDEEEDDE